jgi:hypothetical protein
MSYVFVLANVIDLFDNTSHEQFLRKESDKQTAYHHEKLEKTSQVSQKSEDVRDLALIGIVKFVGSDVHSN